MQDIFAGQIVCCRDLSLPCWFLMVLFAHKLRTGSAKLSPRIGMNGVVDAAVTGAKAAEHLTVCGIDDTVAAKRGNIAFP